MPGRGECRDQAMEQRRGGFPAMWCEGPVASRAVLVAAIEMGRCPDYCTLDLYWR